MNKLLQKFKSKDKKVFYTVMAAGMLAALSVVGFVSANGPAFNIFPIAYNGALNTDYPLLDARNMTKGEGWSTSQFDHDSGVTADPGDVIQFLVYYHNGAPTAPENVAYDVMLKASIPSNEANNFTVGAALSASNAQTVTSAQKGGDIQIKVNGPIGQTLSLVPGSTIWLPNQATSQQYMPDTIASTGISLGSIQACWDFSGFVKFKVKVSEKQAVSALTLEKTVRNVSDNTSYLDEVPADPNDLVEFKLIGTNTGQADLTDLVITDTLPSRLTLEGTVNYSRPIQSGNIFSGGAYLADLKPGENIVITFQARVADVAQFTYGTTKLTNSSTLTEQGATPAGPVTDTASVSVFRPEPQACTILVRATFNGQSWSGNLNYTISGPQTLNGTVVPNDHANVTPGNYYANYNSGGPADSSFTGITPPSGNCPNGGFLTFTYNFTRNDIFDLSIDKTVRNLSTGTQFADQTSAAPSQTVEFKVVIKNIGNTNANNVSVRDVLPAKLNFVNGTLTVNGAAASCQSCFFSGGINLGTMVVNETKTIVFAATVSGQNDFPVGNTLLTNTAYVKADNCNEKSDTATVNVVKEEPQKEDGNGGNRPV